MYKSWYILLRLTTEVLKTNEPFTSEKIWTVGEDLWTTVKLKSLFSCTVRQENKTFWIDYLFNDVVLQFFSFFFLVKGITEEKWQKVQCTYINQYNYQQTEKHFSSKDWGNFSYTFWKRGTVWSQTQGVKKIFT